MSRQREHRGSPSAKNAGPIKPGSTLHRLLEMIAEEIARSQAQGTPEKIDQPNSQSPASSESDNHASGTK